MPALAPFRAEFAEADTAIAARLLAAAPPLPEAHARIATRARGFIAAIRDQKGALGGVEELLREYALSTPEGLALMALAEALLRVPDAATADRLIEDKLSEGDFAHHERRSDALLVSASAWALGVTARLIQPGQTPESLLGTMTKRLGLPAVRQATRQAMRVMGNHFVLGQTIQEALKRADSGTGKLYRYSFDMLGEGARTARDAERYFASYASAITAIGKAAGDAKLPDRPGISVKLSALHPRYEAVSQARVMRELVPRVIELARMARQHELNFTVDAEEADRLELSLDVIAAVVADPSLAGWDGFGLAIQAYQKRASAVIAWIDQLAATHGRRFMVRLVKGAYWDSEVKRAQERGLDAYPVFTRKAMTDLNYEACARQLLAARPRLYPQFATHNALTVATIIEMAGNSDGYEFQRLHGMGEALYEKLMGEGRGYACRTYAPVGGHKDLLAYLVRRLLENGANSSFVSAAGDERIAVDTLLVPPAEQIGRAENAAHPRLPLPAGLYGTSRRNSAGVEIGHAASLSRLQAEIGAATLPSKAASLIAGKERAGPVRRPVRNPATGADIATATDADTKLANEAIDAAIGAFSAWSGTPVAIRADILRKAADRMEYRRGELIKLLQYEAGKTLDDAIAELREAVDFCRFYAAEAEKHFAADGVVLPGPTGEENRLRLTARGVFIAISPWNFPLAIFIGQIAAALAAGNTVVAKPAEQTPLIAVAATRILHEAGVPAGALNLVLGDGVAGAALTRHPAIAGVVFTGSTEVARLINRALAAKDGPIVPLIAETGGINAMIVDATALPEQVTDDVITSAFRSAGQRCSALRLLCVQDEVADTMIEMIVGAARELKLGDPARIDTHIGPVIDAEARQRLDSWVARMKNSARAVHLADPLPQDAPADGHFVMPHVFELRSVADLPEEVFGPVLHVVRWKQKDLPALLAAIRATGYGLTGGLHTRIGEMMDEVIAGLPVGNLYINRNIIGAVVGTQPFGGSGLSGTGPKAGGPHYLMRFAGEQVVTINTAAAGGNASLMAMGE